MKKQRRRAPAARDVINIDAGDVTEIARVLTNRRPRRRNLGPQVHGVSLPKDLYAKICAVADAEHNTTLSVIRRLLSRGLLLEQRLLFAKSDAERAAAGRV